MSRIATLVGRRTDEVMGSSAAAARAALARCLDQGTVVTFETDFVYPSTQTPRRLVLTIVPVSADTAVVHTVDVPDRRFERPPRTAPVRGIDLMSVSGGAVPTAT